MARSRPRPPRATRGPRPAREPGSGHLARPASRRTLPLTLDRLAELPSPCATCLHWELDPVRRGRVREAERAGEKEAWISELLREWGSCGRVVSVEGRVVGFIVYAPPAAVPGADSYATAPVSPDALVLTTAYVDPAHRGGGLGRLLVQGMAADLIQRGGIAAIEAFADRSGRPGRCLIPLEFAQRVGFKTQRHHPTTPRVRLELRSALTWREELEATLDRLLGVVRPPVLVPKARREG